MKGENTFHVVELIFYSVTVIIVAYYLPLFVLLFVFGPLCLKVYSKLSLGFCRSLNRLDGKTVIITGGNAGIGLETAKDLAKRGAKLILACRNMETGKEAIDLITKENGKQNISLKHLDLASLASVRKFAAEIKAEEDKIDILINNAGAATTNKVITSDKMELNCQSNHFAPFLLTNLLLDVIRKSEKGKIINVSSSIHKIVRNFDMDNLNSEKNWSSTMVYARTKAANILFSRELHKRLRAAGITNINVNAVHPGAVRTDFFQHVNEIWYFRIIGFIQSFFFKSVDEGAQTTIHVAVSDDADGVSGEYFADCQISGLTNITKNPELAEKLWDYSAKVVHLKKDETIL